MYGRKSEKLDKETKKKQGYISYFRKRKEKNKGKLPKSTWTSAQWHSVDKEGQQMAKSGVDYRTYRRMKGK